MILGYDASVISGVIEPLTEHLSLSPWQSGGAVSNVILGCVAGAWCVGALSDRIGRKPTLVITAMLFTLSAVGSALADTLTQFVLYRLAGWRAGRRYDLGDYAALYCRGVTKRLARPHAWPAANADGGRSGYGLCGQLSYRPRHDSQLDRQRRLALDAGIRRGALPAVSGAGAVALADALVRPDFKDKGLLDTSVVTIRFDNGAIATAEANFQAVYGYDVRGEVFGSKGMLQAGNINQDNCVRYHADGIAIATSRMDTDLLRDAYVAEMTEFAHCILHGETPRATGIDARNALEIALACIESVQQRKPVLLGAR